jgi:hypothetical protein
MSHAGYFFLRRRAVRWIFVAKGERLLKVVPGEDVLDNFIASSR